MTRVQNLASAIVLLFVASMAVVFAQQAGQPTRGEQGPVFALIGCIERVVPPAPAAGPKPAASAPTFKLTDVQPSSTVPQKPKVYEKEYLVTGPESMAFSKFQNQWVEVTGTIAPPKPPPPAGGDKPAAPPLGTVHVATIKLMSTECK
jgi:hypothetical protein